VALHRRPRRTVQVRVCGCCLPLPLGLSLGGKVGERGPTDGVRFVRETVIEQQTVWHEVCKERSGYEMAEPMSDDDRAGLMDALHSLLILSPRAVQDLQALETAARSVPVFERTLIDGLDEPADGVFGLRTELNGSLDRPHGTLEHLDARVAILRTDVPELAGELAATNERVIEIRDEVADVVEHLPEPESRGPSHALVTRSSVLRHRAIAEISEETVLEMKHSRLHGLESEVTRAVLTGAPREDIDEVIDTSLAADAEKAALRLYSWSLLSRFEAHRVGGEQGTA
jgi:hypothetical protein